MSSSISPNARRWLNTIAFAEGTWGKGAPRYDITFGYTPIKDLSKHPDRVVQGGKYSSAAAGAYQFMPETWARAQKALGLKDFGPQSQDLAALQLLRWRGIDPDRDPLTRENIAKVANEWASLPTMEGRSAYGQPVKSFDTLKKFAESQGASYATTASSAPAQSSAEAEVLKQLLLNKFIDIVGKQPATIGQTQLPRGLETPPLPSYDDEVNTATQSELDLILKSYKDQQEQEAYRKSVEEQQINDVNKNLIAAESAKSQLLAQALGAFGTPKSVI
jgi:muramidase (phage lysozyme)